MPYDSKVEWLASSDSAYVDPELTIEQGDVISIIGGSRDVPASGPSECELFSCYNPAKSDSIQFRCDNSSAVINNGIAATGFVKNNDFKNAIALKTLTNGFCRPVFFAQRNMDNSICHRTYTRVFRELYIYNGNVVRKHYFPVRLGSEGFIFEEVESVLYGNSDTGGTSLLYGPDVS